MVPSNWRPTTIQFSFPVRGKPLAEDARLTKRAIVSLHKSHIVSTQSEYGDRLADRGSFEDKIGSHHF
jgi:hypothetical protein